METSLSRMFTNGSPPAVFSSSQRKRMLNLGSADHKRFEEHWSQYANLVYNLSIVLACSAKTGWLLARDTMLEARLNFALGKSVSTRLWFYQTVVFFWL